MPFRSKEETLADTARIEFSVRDIGMDVANLILSVHLGYRWKAQYMDEYGMWILGEKDGDNYEAKA